MALLAVDVSAHGAVMSADSQRVEILGGKNRVLDSRASRSRNPIVTRAGGGFVGLVGFAGTEQIENRPTAQWLELLNAAWPSDPVGSFCARLAETLTGIWQRERLQSVLEILITGEVAGDLQFWYVRNSRGLSQMDWKHLPPAAEFTFENDLDKNYISTHSLPGESKEGVLGRITFSFRQGVMLPAAPVFDGFSNILQTLHAGNVQGFTPVASLDDLGHFARVRMEFLKRLCSARYGIYADGTPTPIDGDVHVFGVGPDGRIAEYAKKRDQIKTLRSGRAPDN